MHGIVFTSFRHFVTSRAGPERTAALWATEPPYLITQSYPDDSFLRLFGRVATDLSADGDELLREFGAFAGERTFVLLYPSYFDEAGSSVPFLLGIEERIHELVRATMPGAEPPRLLVEPAGDSGDAVRIAYTSPRRLCPLLVGLVEGTARHFRERAHVRELACMREGADACLFEARFEPLRRAG